MQAATLANPKNTAAACMTLFLGKLAIMFRNAIEHGNESVVNGRLHIHTEQYWANKRGNGNVFDWLLHTAKKISWPSSLPAALPKSATSFVLTPASLQRSLTLMSLVLQSTFRHLKL
jgi:hypothetical protein